MERWRDEQELARVECWTLADCRRHLGISERTLRRYRAAGLEVHEGRVDGRRVALVKRTEAQAHFRGKRHAARSARFQA